MSSFVGICQNFSRQDQWFWLSVEVSPWRLLSKAPRCRQPAFRWFAELGGFVGFHFDEFGKISFQSHVRNPNEYWSIWSQRLHQVFCCRNSSSSKSSTLVQLLAEVVRSKRWFWMKGWAACLPVDPLRSQKGSSTSKSKSCFAEGMAGRITTKHPAIEQAWTRRSCCLAVPSVSTAGTLQRESAVCQTGCFGTMLIR